MTYAPRPIPAKQTTGAARKPQIFLSAPGRKVWTVTGHDKDPARSVHLAGLVGETLGVEPKRFRTFMHLWGMRRAPFHGQPVDATLSQVMQRMDGFVLVVPACSVPVGAGVLAELAAAERAGLPMLAVTADGDVAPIDACTVEPLTGNECRPPRRVARFVMPDGGARLSEVRPVLAAMGFGGAR